MALDGGPGQTATRQLDGLAGIGQALAQALQRCWAVGPSATRSRGLDVRLVSYGPPPAALRALAGAA